MPKFSSSGEIFLPSPAVLAMYTKHLTHSRCTINVHVTTDIHPGDIWTRYSLRPQGVHGLRRREMWRDNCNWGYSGLGQWSGWRVAGAQMRAWNQMGRGDISRDPPFPRPACSHTPTPTPGNIGADSKDEETLLGKVGRVIPGRKQQAAFEGLSVIHWLTNSPWVLWVGGGGEGAWGSGKGWGLCTPLWSWGLPKLLPLLVWMALHDHCTTAPQASGTGCCLSGMWAMAWEAWIWFRTLQTWEIH